MDRRGKENPKTRRDTTRADSRKNNLENITKDSQNKRNL